MANSTAFLFFCAALICSVTSLHVDNRWFPQALKRLVPTRHRPSPADAESESSEAGETDGIAPLRAAAPKCDFIKAYASKTLGVSPEAVWVVFVGDSNMRHTYHWFVDSVLGSSKRINSTEFGLDRTDLPDGGRWADQEAVAEIADGLEVRVSFRFLHGSPLELDSKFFHWHDSYLAGSVNESSAAADDFALEDPDAKRPSEWALLATRQNKLIDHSIVNPKLDALLKKYSEREPDAVVLTEGWGGIPTCTRFPQMLQKFEQHPKTDFVWAPVYVSNRQEERQACFVDAVRNISLTAQDTVTHSGDNYRIVDLWDLAKKLNADDEEMGGITTHIEPGEYYMREAYRRLADGFCDLAGNVNK